MKLTFVVLTSFYPASQQALEYADALCNAVHGRLLLLHAKRVSFFDPYIFAGEAWHQQELKEEADTKALLDRRVQQLHSRATLEMATDLLPDMARDLAKKHQPALFVLGRPGPEKISFEHLSPVAMELLRVVQLPMLLVPLGAPVPAVPQRVLIAADDEDFALGDTHGAVHQLLTSLRAELTVAHVTPLEDDASCARALHAVQHSGLTKGLPEPTLRGYQAELPAEGVLAAVRDINAGLVVVMARTRSYLGELFHKSVTAQIIQHSPVPVLVVPAKAPATAPHQRVGHQHGSDDILLWPTV
ncbi:universal stress protein [Hymenobacter sp. BT770]|uniref:universal stress protein n=1 Tax=Hymenobacter sp. BT770 TaxID=2886942 RepID=UPI001D10403B|nr:universal stress protein [Hymenobacter sp. BT770]MCC3155163.1 universal stress protein [Hymenobacter sp. BT770]MDO3417211.1 universal stress protein [Hymenobacter sp. BT770]